MTTNNKGNQKCSLLIIRIHCVNAKRDSVLDMFVPVSFLPVVQYQ